MGKEQKNHDLYVEQLDFDWLMDEIENGKKGKVAFVIGWFNCVDCFPQLFNLEKVGEPTH